MTTSLDMPRFLLDDARTMRDPYPVYAELRSLGLVCRGGPGQRVFSRHEEVAGLPPDPGLGRVRRRAHIAAARVNSDLILMYRELKRRGSRIGATALCACGGQGDAPLAGYNARLP